MTETTEFLNDFKKCKNCYYWHYGECQFNQEYIIKRRSEDICIYWEEK